MQKDPLFNLSYGLFVLTAFDGRHNGCIVNTIGQVASDPDKITLAVNKLNLTHDMILDTGRFCASIISEDAEFELFKRFGFASGREVDKFEGFASFKETDGLIAVTEGTNSYITGKVTQTIDLGTHTLFIADVASKAILSDSASATYSFYHSNIKPKPQESEKKEGKTAWRCRICGYIYEGEVLPEDYICPLCKHPASDFEKITL